MKRNVRIHSIVQPWDVTAMVKVYVRPQDRWAALFPANSETPGFYRRVVATGGGDMVWEKVSS